MKLIRWLAIASFLLPAQTMAARPLKECDQYSLFAHAYYQSALKRQENAHTIAKAELELYTGPHTLSPFTLTRAPGPARAFNGQLLGQSGGAARLVHRFRNDHYTMLLIPPRTAARYFGQLARSPNDPAQLVEMPALLAVPREAFRDGRCRAGDLPLLIANAESRVVKDIAHYLLPQDQLRQLIAALFMDPRSDNLDALLQEYDQKIINRSTWGGWIDLTIDHHRRGILDRLLGRAAGRPAHLPGIIETNIEYSAPPLQELLAENLQLDQGWKQMLSTFKVAVIDTQGRIDRLSKVLAAPSVDMPAYLLLTAEISDRLQEHRTEISRQQRAMESARSYFMTDTEIDFLATLMQRHIDDLVSRFNELEIAYQRRLEQSEGFDEKLFLSPLPYPASTGQINPVEVRNHSVLLKEIKSSLPISYVAYLATSSEKDKVEVRVNGLVNLTQSMRVLSHVIRSKVMEQQSCKLRVRSVNTDIRPSIRNGRFIKPVDVELQIRACMTISVPSWCGHKYCTKKKRIATNLYKTTADANGWLNVDLRGTDAAVNFGYSACAHGWFCSRDNYRLQSLLAVMAESSDLKKFMTMFGPSFRIAALRQGKDGSDYLAMQLTTRPLPKEEALVLLELIREIKK
ncbi:MAG: hypothetical protein WBJ03_11880 [Moraxellaceae bacterium]